MRAVAATAQTRLGHVQYCFPSRTELIAALLRRTLDRSLDRLAPLFVDAAAHIPPDTEGLVRQLLAEHDDPRLVRVYAELWALAGRDEAVAAVTRAFYGAPRGLRPGGLEERRRQRGGLRSRACTPVQAGARTSARVDPGFRRRTVRRRGRTGAGAFEGCH